MTVYRAAAALSALSLLLVGCGGGDDATGGGGSTIETGAAGDPVTLQAACAPNYEHIPRHLADTQGFFEERNLTVECLQVATGPEQSAAMLSGDLDVGFMNAANLAPLLAQDQDLVAFGNLRTAPYWELVVDNDYELPNGDQSWEDVMRGLEGARLGVVARGAAAEITATALLRAAGVDPASVTFIATGITPTTIAALEGNTIDAAMMFEPGVTVAVESGIGTNPFSIQAGEGPDELFHPDFLMVTSRANAEQNPDVLCRLSESLDAGLEFAHDTANRDATLAATMELLSLDEATAGALLDRSLGSLAESTALDAEGIDKAFALLAENGVTPEPITTDSFAVEVC